MHDEQETCIRTEPEWHRLFDLVSPLDFRYYGRSNEIYEKLQPYLSEDAFIKYMATAEAALANTLAEMEICSNEVAIEIENASKLVTASEVYLEEDKVEHPVKALVNCIRKRVSDRSKPYVHLSLTSNDIISPADAARYRDFTNNVLLLELFEMGKTLITLSRREKNTLQIGRTHGQYAEPITFGFYIAQYISRIGGRISKIKETANDLRGKVAGAVGAYNASSILVRDPVQFEKQILLKLGLKPSPVSTQIVEAEFMTDYVHSIISAFGVLANLADDMRHLQRSEISEVQESFGKEQVGSSTMPQKRNPVNFEYVKSMWKTVMPRMVTVYSDQISEHQRDLTNLESSRFIAEILTLFYYCLCLMRKLMATIHVDRRKMKENFGLAKDMLIAEPAHTLLASYGHPDAYEYIKRLIFKSRKSGISFTELFFKDKEVQSYLRKFDEYELEILRKPEEKYVGRATQKVEDVCRYWERELEALNNSNGQDIK